MNAVTSDFPGQDHLSAHPARLASRRHPTLSSMGAMEPSVDLDRH